MNEQLFLQQVDKEDFERVVKYLHAAYDAADYKKSRILREQLIADVFGQSQTKEDFAEKRHALEMIARASKTDWGQKLYEQATGSKGFIQATAINKKSYYEAVVGMDLEKYNPRTYVDIHKLVTRAVPYITQNPSMSAEEISSKLSREYGYVVGSILPSVGTIRAYFNKLVQNLSEALVQTVTEGRSMIFANDKEMFLKKVSEVFDAHAFVYDADKIAKVVANKLHNK